MSTLRDDCQVVVRDLATDGPTGAPVWRGHLSDRAGMSLDRLGKALDFLGSIGFVRRLAPRKNDEWVLTSAGYHAWWLYAESLPGSPIHAASASDEKEER